MAFNLRELNDDVQVTLFEAREHVGGNLRTLRRDGFQLEWGPNGFLDSEPATRRLVDRLGLEGELQRSDDAAARRFLYVRGQIREIPMKPGAFLRSGLLPLGAKLRVACEVFVRRRKELGRAAEDPSMDETVAEFGTRRLGARFTETFLDPMVKGVFGGNPHKLSLAAAFPRMVELEQEYGGLFRAMSALGRKRKKEGKPEGGGAGGGPSGTLHSFLSGMGALPEALFERLRDDDQVAVLTSTPVESISRKDEGWMVHSASQVHGPFDAVVDAAPAHAAALQLAEAAPELSKLLAEIPFAPMVVIALGFDRRSVGHDLDGFGMLIPGMERRQLLGALWTSSIFPGRAPKGRVLLRCMTGGIDNPTVLDQDDADLVEMTLSELREPLSIGDAPIMTEVIRHARAIAQYIPGHPARLAAIDRELASLPGLYLTGASYRGIAVNSCVKEAEALAPTVLGLTLGSEPDQAC
jgi:oxygen-dependent protoporphyrinogen oxidase